MMKSRVVWAIGIIGVLGGVAGMSSAQTQPSPKLSGSSDELLAEVRGLRAELNQAASASIRTQLLVARLQLQEQRINVVAGQLTEVRRLITNQEAGQIRPSTELKHFEDVSRDVNLLPEQQKENEMRLAHVKAQLAESQREVQQLQVQEAELSNQLAAEQGRWMDFNSRLDELERQLQRR